jgi:TolB-like protein
VTRDETLYEFGAFRLNPAERSLTAADGAPLQLTRRLYDTLLYMVERPGRLIEKQALFDAVWKGVVVEENTLSRTISTLRQTLGERAGDKRYIETVSGLGYRFVQPVLVRTKQEPSPRPPRNDASLAVLPFEDLSREHDEAYFADGIAEEVLTRLSRVPGLRLVARSSSFRFRNSTHGAQEIGRQLGVDFLLVGAVRKEEGRLRITAQLIEAATDSQRWSERFDRAFEIGHILAVQEDIARAVATALSATLGGDKTATTQRGTRDLLAYDLFLRAKAITEQAGTHSAVRGVELYRAAVTRDPVFVEAWLGLAYASRSKFVFAPELAAQASKDIAEAAERMAALAPDWWASHLVQGWVGFGRDLVAQHRSFERVLELAPGYPLELIRTLVPFYATVNDPRAIELTRLAVRNDPLSMLWSGIYQIQLHVAGREDEAENEYRRSLDLAGDREMAEHLAIHRLWARGLPFREQFRRYLDLTESRPAPVLEDVYAASDSAERSLELLRAAANAPEYQNPVRQMVLAWWLAHYGDIDAAFAAVWRGMVDLKFRVTSWLWLPVFAHVREHARFPDILDRVGLIDYWRATSSSHAAPSVRRPGLPV